MQKQEFEEEDVVSATECTGLVQSPPLDEAEQDSYRAIYPYCPKKR